MSTAPQHCRNCFNDVDCAGVPGAAEAVEVVRNLFRMIHAGSLHIEANETKMDNPREVEGRILIALRDVVAKAEGSPQPDETDDVCEYCGKDCRDHSGQAAPNCRAAYKADSV